MIDKKIMLLAPGVVLGVMAMAAESAGPVIFPERSGISSKAEALENIGRQELLFRSTAMVNQANKLMQEAKYREAIAKYREVVKLLSPTGAGERFKEKIDFCRKRISECYYMMADEAMKKADDLVTSYDFDVGQTLRRGSGILPGTQRRIGKTDQILFHPAPSRH